MRPAVGVAALLAAVATALATAQPLQEQPAEATTQQPPANNSGEAPPPPPPPPPPPLPPLVEEVMQLVVDVSRIAMELHRRGGSQLVTARRLNISDEPSLLMTFHRSAEAAAASLEPNAPTGQQTSQQLTGTTIREDVDGRAVDYESSAEESLSDPLPLANERLPPPVVPRVEPMALPLVNVGDGKEVRHEMAHRSRTNDTVRGGRKPTKGMEISDRSAEVEKVSRMVLAMVSNNDSTSGLSLLFRFLEAVNRAVDAVKRLVTRLGGFRAGGSGDGSGSRRRDIGGKQAPASQDFADRVASLLEATEHARGANPTEVPGR